MNGNETRRQPRERKKKRGFDVDQIPALFSKYKVLYWVNWASAYSPIMSPILTAL